MSGPIDGGYRDTDASRRRLDSASQRASNDRELRRSEEVRDLARRDAFRRAVLGPDSRRAAEVRFVRSPTRRPLPMGFGDSEFDFLRDLSAKPIGSLDRLSALVAAADRKPKAVETRPSREEDPGTEETTVGDPSDPIASSLSLEPRATSISGGGERGDHAGAESGRRTFDFAARFAAFAELRTTARSNTELELRLATSFAGEVLVVLTALGDRRVALRARGAAAGDRSIDLTGLVTEMREAGLVVVKPTEDKL